MAVDFFKGKKITLVASPTDLRSGYFGLSALADTALGINVSKGKDVVIFVSRKRDLCKMIWSDQTGFCLQQRRLHRGRFSRWLMSAQGDAKARLSIEQFQKFFTGERLQVERTHPWNG